MEVDKDLEVDDLARSGIWRDDSTMRRGFGHVGRNMMCGSVDSKHLLKVGVVVSLEDHRFCKRVYCLALFKDLWQS